MSEAIDLKLRQVLAERLPELSRQLLLSAEQKLREPGKNPAAQSSAAKALQATQPGLQLSCERAFLEALKPEPPARALTRHSGPLNLDELTLVDEAQAERDIEISRSIQQIELRAEWELRDLSALHASLSAEDHAHPLRSAAFGRALSAASQGMTLDATTRQALMAALSAALAEQMQALAAFACEQLQAWGVKPKPFARPSTSSRTGHGPAAAGPAQDPGLDIDRPGALETLRGRLGPSEVGTPELLGRLFQQFLADAELHASVKQHLSQMQSAVLALSQREPTLLDSQRHPTWTLINQIAAHAADHPADTDPRGSAFLVFVSELVHKLSALPQPDRAAFDTALTDLQGYIAQEQREQLQQSEAAVDALSRQERHLELLGLLRPQVLQQAQASSHLTPALLEFLLGPWTEVLARAIADEGADAAHVQELMVCVDDLLSSLEPTADNAARLQLRERLPSLIQRLQQGMDLIELGADSRNAFLDELMSIHRERLLPPARKPVPVAPPPAEARQAAATPALSDEQALLRELLQPETDQDRWSPPSQIDTSIGHLPTVPMGLDDGEQDTATSPSAWVGSLRPGTRCKMFLQGHWASAQLLWRSDSASFFMFSSQMAGGMHTMTRRALERLRAEGLATEVAEPSLMQRAVNRLLRPGLG
ncbi:DUF1631 family protein [Roseateles sp.]|jgi:hypothetical protein|uniref:DUF1631 family protein n=1 Tax=Roseateles sp. TaxID=1971397 RepID=UPI0037CB85AB